MRKPETESSESELRPLLSSRVKSIRRIRWLSTKQIQPQESGEPSVTESDGEPSNETDKAGIDELTKLGESHPRFGPVYAIHQGQLDSIKNRAWNHILEKSPDDAGVTIELYLSAIREVEKEAKERYAGRGSSNSGSKFRWMMIKDGCFFLQLALLILGCSQQLGYATNDPFFVLKEREKVKIWVEAMFYVGNQIPLIVLRQLMKQKFFQAVIGAAKWEQPVFSSSMCQRVLYNILVVPTIRINNRAEQEQLCDLLHGCQRLLLGPSITNHVTVISQQDEIDLEANEDEGEEYEIISRNRLDDNKQNSPGNDFGRTMIFPSASELKRQGIYMKKLESGGARGIIFKNYYFWANVYLPTFQVDGFAELIFQNLMNYDKLQQSGQNVPEISSYLRFMSDLVQTGKDADLLKRKDIIQGKSHAKLPKMLKKLTTGDIKLTQEMQALWRQISDFSSPWVHYKQVINIVVVLTLIQTIFAFLAYLKPPKQN